MYSDVPYDSAWGWCSKILPRSRVAYSRFLSKIINISISLIPIYHIWYHSKHDIPSFGRCATVIPRASDSSVNPTQSLHRIKSRSSHCITSCLTTVGTSIFTTPIRKSFGLGYAVVPKNQKKWYDIDWNRVGFWLESGFHITYNKTNQSDETRTGKCVGFWLTVEQEARRPEERWPPGQRRRRNWRTWFDSTSWSREERKFQEMRQKMNEKNEGRMLCWEC